MSDGGRDATRIALSMAGLALVTVSLTALGVSSASTVSTTYLLVVLVPVLSAGRM